jgi:hypothetical protein
MEMRIVVPDAASADALAQRLSMDFGPERVSLAGERGEVGVEVAGDSDRAVVRILDAIQRWFDHVGAGSAELWLGGNSYRLAR